MNPFELLLWAAVIAADFVIIFVLSALVVGMVRGIKIFLRDRGK